MSRVCALVLAVIGAVFVYLALQLEGGLSLTGTAGFYLTVAFVAFVKAALFAAADFVEE